MTEMLDGFLLLDISKVSLNKIITFFRLRNVKLFGVLYKTRTRRWDTKEPKLHYPIPFV